MVNSTLIEGAAPGCVEGGEGERTATDRDRLLHVMHRSGDIKISFDPNSEVEVEFAETVFKRALKNGMLAYTVHVDGEGETTKELHADDPKGSPKTVLTPALQGG